MLKLGCKVETSVDFAAVAYTCHIVVFSVSFTLTVSPICKKCVPTMWSRLRHIHTDVVRYLSSANSSQSVRSLFNNLCKNELVGNLGSGHYNW